MQLRSGHSTSLRRDSRNQEEFNERRKYQAEQRLIENSIYEEPETNKINKIFHKMSHFTYLNKCQQDNNSSFHQRVKNIYELYDHLRINVDEIIIYSCNKNDKRLLRTIYAQGLQLIEEMTKNRKTRGDKKLVFECKDMIDYVLNKIEESL